MENLESPDSSLDFGKYGHTKDFYFDMFVYFLFCRCSLKAECKFANEPLHFVSDSTSKCPKIVSVSPDPTALSVWYQKEVCFIVFNSFPSPMADALREIMDDTAKRSG